MAHENPLANVQAGFDPINTVLASAQYVVQAAAHWTYQVSPRGIIFHWDMLLPIPLLTDYNLLRQCQQTAIDENNQ